MKNNRLLYVIIAFLVLWLTLLTASKQEETLGTKEKINEYEVSGFSTDFTNVIDENKDSVVSIEVGKTISSGFVYNQIGNTTYVVCTYHGVSQNDDIYVVFDNSYRIQASLLGYDAYCDLAVLTFDIPYEVKALKLGDASLLKQGEFVVCIGTPTSLEYKGSVELGMVSKNDLSLLNSITNSGVKDTFYSNVMQISANLTSGYSGSPILNMNGELVGMNIMEDNDDHNFALTVNEIRYAVDNIINGNNVAKTQFDIKVQYISKLKNYEKSSLNIGIEQLNGLYVEKEIAGGMAYNIGIKGGDIISTINGLEINDLDDLLSVAYSGTESFEFKVIRNNEELLITGLAND